MPENQVTTVANRDLATMPLEQALDAYSSNFQDALPAHISVEHFKRMVVTAVNLQPDLVRADRRSFFNSCVKCAHDGLIPDGRDAALVVFNGVVAYLPMVAGIRKRMRNSGEILSATAEIVCKNDQFKHELGDNGYITHVPTPLDQDPGDIVGAYAIIKLRSGEVIRDVMRRGDIEKSRQQGRARNSLMWDKFYGEGCKKTVLRRCAKSAPQASELERLLGRDEETEEGLMPADPPPPRPQRTDFTVHDGGAGETIVENTPEPQIFALINLDGEEEEFGTVKDILARMIELAEEAATRGLKAIDGFIESNGVVLEYLRETGNGEALKQFFGRANVLAKEATEATARKKPNPQTTGAVNSVTPPVDGGASDARMDAAGQNSVVTSGPTATTAVSPSEAPAEGGYERHAEAATDAAQTIALPRNAWYDGTDLALAPRTKNGRPDWSTWMSAQFLPRVRTATTTADFARFLGDNEKNIRQCKTTLGQPASAELQTAIDTQWKKIPADS